MLHTTMYTVLRNIEGIPKFPVLTSQFEGRTFHFPKYTAEGHRYFKIENWHAVSISTSAAVDLKASVFDDMSRFCSSSFNVDGQRYYIAVTDDQQVYIAKYEDIQEAVDLSCAGVRMIDIPDFIIWGEQILKGRSDDVSNVLLTIQTMTDIDEDTACRLIYREMTKLTNQRRSSYRLLMRIFQTPEFINATGATQWLREASERGREIQVLSFVDLGAEPLTSLKHLDDYHLTCIEQDGPYRLLSSCTGAGAIWLKSNSAFFQISDKPFILSADEQTCVPLGSNVLLDNVYMNHQLRLSDNPIITVEGDNTITVGHHDSCIYAHGVITVNGSGILRLNCSTRSAAIGSGAESQSHGRYASNFHPAAITKIIIDGVQLIVHSDTPNFSIGTYGVNNRIPIEVINGGRVTGIPEMLGKVTLESVGITNARSTKIEGNAVYELTPFEESNEARTRQYDNKSDSNSLQRSSLFTKRETLVRS